MVDDQEEAEPPKHAALASVSLTAGDAGSVEDEQRRAREEQGQARQPSSANSIECQLAALKE